METMMALKIALVALLAIPVLALSFYLTGKLMDELIERAGKNK